MSNTKFRTDINGLRAIAVISVVLFHFGVTGFSGGFVGVDIFFVISGFLMTGIVARGIDKGNFGFIDFYLARARRIIPALFFLAVVLLVVGWFYLSPNDYSKLSKEVDRSILFLSNNYFFKKSGYFDPSSHERLLLHTWSLSIEWQFYVLYPVLLIFVSKLNLKLLPKIITLFFIVSFSYSVFKSYSDPSYAFYMLPSRAWEMFLGGLVYYATKQSEYIKNKSMCYFLGFIFIVASIFYYTPETTWPGFPALLPALGTALIIYAGKESFFTSNFAFQKIGDWSYSIYLWHWPLAVAILLFDIEKNASVIFWLISLSVFLGAISFFYIENPARQFLTSNNKIFVFLLILFPVILILTAAKIIREYQGFPERLPENIYTVFEQANNKYYELEKCHDNKDKIVCAYGNGDIGAIVVGDSHAMSVMWGVVSVLNERRVLDWTRSGCPTILNIQTKSKDPAGCSNFLSSNFKTLPEYPGVPLLLTNRYSSYLIGFNEYLSDSKAPDIYFDKPYDNFSAAYLSEIYNGYVDTLCSLAKTNPVYILKPNPELKLNVPEVMGRSLLIGQEKRVSVSLAEYNERNEVALRLLDDVASKCNVTLLDPIPYLCDGERCYGDVDGLPIFFDDDHLNMRGADLLKPLFEERLLIK